MRDTHSSTPVQPLATRLLLLLVLAVVVAACAAPAEQPVEVEPIEPTAEDAAAEDAAAEDAAAEPTAEDAASDDAAAEPTAEDAASDDAAAEPTAEDAASDDAAAEPTAEDAASDDAAAEPTPEEEVTAAAYTTPHPILSDLRVRQAIAHCADRLELIESVYPFLSPEEQNALLMDTFLPQGHWALAPADMITTYPFDPQQGTALLEEAGWTLADDANVRSNADGDLLTLDFVTTDAQFRQTWAAVLEQQLLNNCGIQMVRTHAPSSFVFGDTTGLQRREFDLAGFAWVGSADPKGSTLYTCDQIPLPSNNWEGQNYMGWCNEEASRAILAANNRLDRAERAEQYAIVQREFTADMVSLPLFNRLAVAAISPNLLNYEADPTEYQFANAAEWELADGGETVVVGVTQEPETLFTLVHSFSGAISISFLIDLVTVTTYNYDYQPRALTQLPTVENGGAILDAVEMSEGDLVWSVDGEAVELAPGMEVLNAQGDTVVYDEGSVTMAQLSVTFEYVEGVLWEDGEPLTQADFELGQAITCDPESGAVSYRWCESQTDVEFIDDRTYTINYLPGALWPEYFAYTYTPYPAHQELSDGRMLADVPASEWVTLPEINDTPLSLGPYRIIEWQKGQRLILEANPNYWGTAPAIPNLVIVFIEDSTQGAAQLLTGEIDALGKFDLGAGPEVETVLDAAETGDVEVFTIASPTWEHLDMNLFTR